jgi:hypothetical protein
VEAAQQPQISPPFIATRATPDWHSNGGSAVSKCAMATAKRMFRRAIASRNISQYGREEAMYHLALQFIDEGKLRLALPLLKLAAADGDYPEAASVLKQIETKSGCVPCRCKRLLNKHLRGHSKCLVHAR